MPFSQQRQPRYAVYVVRHGRAVLVARYGTLAKALVQVAQELESGEIAYHDVNL